MPYKDEYVVNSILQKAFNEKCPDMTPMKLQKILYFLNGWGLAITGQPILQSDFEAWDYGPVVPKIYTKTKSYGSNPITSYLINDEEKVYVVSPDNREFYDILNMVWDKYIHFDAYTLSGMTHQLGSPWSENRKENNIGVIPNKVIRNYFLTLARGQVT